jgi:hypothetical protein
MRIEIVDTAYHKSMLTVTITTPNERTEYNEETVRHSAKQLVDALSTHTSSGFCRALEDALRDGRTSPCDILGA